jgi:hypothetical protein
LPRAANRNDPTKGRMQKISAFVLAYNEAEKIKAAVETVLWADEIVVVDSHSTDGTPQIAESLGARVVQVPFNGFGELRNRAVEACRYDWIFSLDSDERCTEAVRDEVLALLAGSPPHDVYQVPRRNYMMGRRIRGSGWYPNFRQPQLFRKGAMRYTLEPVHEGYELLSDKPLGTLGERGQRVNRDQHRLRKVVRCGLDVAAGQLVLVGERYGVDDEVDRAPGLRGRIERSVDGRGFGHIAVSEQNTADLRGERFDALFQRISLESETELGALGTAGLGNTPGNRAVVRDAKDDAALAAHQTARFSHSDPSFGGSLPDSACAPHRR